MATTPILSGNVEWYRDPTQPGVWYARYRMPHSRRFMVFEASAEQMNAIFGTSVRPPVAGRLTLAQITQREQWTYAGNISEMEGEGSFDAEVERVIALARDEGRMPEWLEGSDKAWDLLYMATMENKSDTWLLEQWSKLKEFKQHYPGLGLLQDQGLSLLESVGAFNEFNTQLAQLWTSMGKDPKMIRRATVGALLAAGHSITSIADSVASWKRMRRHAPAFEAFNQILVASGQDPLNEAGMMNFLRGVSPSEMYDLYEASSFQEAANQAGLGSYFKPQYAITAALQTPGISDLSSVSAGMATAANALLRLRHELNLNKFGLNHEDLIDVSLGLAPRSGATEADIRENVDRAMAEAQGWLSQKRVGPYRSYSSQGVPQSGSLSRSRPGT